MYTAHASRPSPDLSVRLRAILNFSQTIAKGATIVGYLINETDQKANLEFVTACRNELLKSPSTAFPADVKIPLMRFFLYLNSSRHADARTCSI